MKILHAYLFDNGNLAAFDDRGQQVPELQGQYCINKHEKILLLSTPDTEFKGFDILPSGFIRTVHAYVDIFKGQALTWEQIQEL